MKQFLLLLLIVFVSTKNLRNLDDFNFESFYNELILKHNILRAKHNSPSLTRLDDLAELAKVTLDGCIAAGTLVHSGTSYNGQWMGQNLHLSSYPPTADSVLNGWYTKEEKNYDYDTGKSANGGVVGHFTQVVWKSSKQIGCAVKTGAWGNYANSYYVCCNYFPGGNWVGEETQNVERPSS